jgi:hypothetical protein
MPLVVLVLVLSDKTEFRNFPTLEPTTRRCFCCFVPENLVLHRSASAVVPRGTCLLGCLDNMTNAIIGRSEYFLAWCSMLGPLQAISPECCLEIVELALPELVSPMQVPARKSMSVDCVCTRNPAARFGSCTPELHASNFQEEKRRKKIIKRVQTYCSHGVGYLLQRWCMN